MQYAIGIDGGGTKTKVLVKSRDGETVATFSSGPTNPTGVGVATILKRLDELIGPIDREFCLKTRSVCYGMSGYSALSGEERVSIENHIKRYFPESTIVSVTNDAISALYSGTKGKEGVVSIAGTGSIVYGVNQRGVVVRADGWGYLFDHSGSGYGIGHAAIKTVMKESDRGEGLSPFSKEVLAALNVSEPRDIVSALNQGSDFKQMVASLSPVVFRLNDAGDVLAGGLLNEAAQAISQSILNVRSRLFNEKEEVILVCTGSLFLKQKALFNRVAHLIKREPLKPITPTCEPVEGAVYAAWNLVGGE
ncbi:N-acetylglucosamine kinase [Alteribacter aurantiacus]|uniref:N-acetylglucosamine kinase n=1 Tax=Alteribacter aurantiacus TaxID=254410 RepID=UPI00041E4DF6|nr:BadF/BadG/BcrA/BcrD ATPase family protein [Alteribacter aurantiacus]